TVGSTRKRRPIALNYDRKFLSLSASTAAYPPLDATIKSGVRERNFLGEDEFSIEQCRYGNPDAKTRTSNIHGKAYINEITDVTARRLHPINMSKPIVSRRIINRNYALESTSGSKTQCNDCWKRHITRTPSTPTRRAGSRNITRITSSADRARSCWWRRI